jgi:2-succinyl-5-enolpyruvyl-6-hydroxy-3-cyclohexene-1-carboxylate synthase
VHINVPFREPLLPAPSDPVQSGGEHAAVRVSAAHRAPTPELLGRLAAIAAEASRVFVHAGPMPPDERTLAALRDLSSRDGVVVHAEPMSHLRVSGVAGLLRNTEALLRDDEFAERHRPDLLIRLGAAPTSRVLNEWLARSRPRRALLIDPDAVWADPDVLATDVLQCDPADTLQALAGALTMRDSSWRDEWLTADAAAGDAIASALEKAPLSEAKTVRALARAVPTPSTLVIGSSLAVRDADWFWPPSDGHRFVANRGASGIDGFVSTALGAAAADAQVPTVALCGDLTLYHDMNGLLAAQKYSLPVAFVVLDNDGGGIFSFLREAAYEDVFEAVFATPTGLDLAKVAALYGCEYRRARDIATLERAVAGGIASQVCTIVDVQFTRDASVKSHRAVWAAAASAIHAARRAAPGI